MSKRVNRVMVMLAFAALAELLACAGEPVQNTNQVSASGPRIQFAEPVFDFGKVQAGQIVTHDYLFTNTGNSALEISDVKSSCGCTAVTNWDRRIEPGKTGTLHVLFNTGGMAGPVTKSLWVISNDREVPAALLEFTATVWKWIDAIPTLATFTFGPDFQTNETRVIRLVNNADQPVTLSTPVCTNRSFKADLKTIKEGKEFELRITVVPPLGPGSVVAPITMDTSSPKMPVVTVNAYAVVQAALTVTPPRILLTPPLAESQRYVVTIRNSSSHPVTLSAPGINVDGASVQLREVQPGRLFELAVTFPAGFKGRHDQPIEARIESNHQQSPIIKVPVIQLEPAPD
jgi:hypothetical protein